jgi:hypothetical protein
VSKAPERKPFPPELIDWAVAQYNRPKMLHIEVSRRFFYAVRDNPDSSKMTAVGEGGVEVIERPHRKRMPSEDVLGPNGYHVLPVLRKED